MLLETLGENILISPWILKMPLQRAYFARKLDLCIEKNSGYTLSIKQQICVLKGKRLGNKARQELSFKSLH